MYKMLWYANTLFYLEKSTNCFRDNQAFLELNQPTGEH